MQKLNLGATHFLFPPIPSAPVLFLSITSLVYPLLLSLSPLHFPLFSSHPLPLVQLHGGSGEILGVIRGGALAVNEFLSMLTLKTLLMVTTDLVILRVILI